MIAISGKTDKSKFRLYAELSRPKHWLKNILVFVPIVYAHSLFEPGPALSVLAVFCAFCLMSSAVYVINDIFDAPKDRLHPIKCSRPVASGQVSKTGALVFAAIMFAGGALLIIVRCGIGAAMLIAVCYVLLNILYSLKLKDIAVIDCFCIAAGFALRTFAGAAAYGGYVSDWLFLMIITISLFMAFGKRRGEILCLAGTGATRGVLAKYNVSFLNGMINICAGLSIVFYTLWALFVTSAMLYTVPLVIFIVCRYLLVIHGNTSHSDPITVIFGDKVLIVSAALFAVASIVLLYLMG